MELLGRRLLFVTGKGGVGKTTIAAAIAQLSASRGARTLVCEMDRKGALAAALDTSPLRFAPRQIDTDLFAMAMDTEDSLREYLRLFTRIPFAGRIGPLAHTFDFVADAAPGVKEILAVGKLCYEVRERHYDLVVVDAEASGHVVGQIGAPRAIGDLVHVGMVRDQTRWMLDILDDPQRTALVAVTTPEEMPVNETVTLVGRVRAETRVDVAGIVANRVLPALFGQREAAVFAALGNATVGRVVSSAVGGDALTVLAAAQLTEARRKVGGEHLQRLRTELAGMPVVNVPELFTRAGGRRVVNLVADALADEL